MSNIETRRVQQTGGSSFIISLPKEWIDNHGIKPKDTIGIIAQPDGNLLITPYMNSQEYIKKKEIDVDDIENTGLLFRLLVGAYIMGYSIIEIITSKEKFQTEFRECIQSFTDITMGTEIIEESNNRINIKDLLNPKEMPFQKIIRRMYVLAQDMHEEAVKALEMGDKVLAEKVIVRDDEIDKLNWLVERQSHIVLRDIILCQKLGITLEDASNFQLIAKFLERIADHATNIARNVLNIDFDKIDEILLQNIYDASEFSLSMLNMSLDAWLQKDISLANENIDSLKELAIITKNIKIKGNQSPSIQLSSIVESIKRTGEYSSDISEIIINNLI
jgi:phosphate uptake regulator